MRTTRAAARAAATQLDNNKDMALADATMLPAPMRDREPLRSITPNSIDSGDIEKPTDDETTMPTKKGKAKGKKAPRTKKSGKKAKTSAPSAPMVDELQDEDDAVPAAMDSEIDIGDNKADVAPRTEHVAGIEPRKVDPLHDILVERPASPTVKKELLAKANMSPDSAPILQCLDHDTIHIETEATDPFDAKEMTVELVQKSSLETATEQSATSTTTSLLTSPTITVPYSEDPIDAIDALEDALEEVGKILPKSEPVSPEKPAAKKKLAFTTRTASTVKRAAQSLAAKLQTPARSATRPIEPKTTTTRKLASNTLARTTQPSTLIRSQSVRATPSAAKARAIANTRTPTVANRPTVVLPGKDGDAKPNGNTDYLASRRRPVSMHFPPPPGPIKSTKPLTKPTFTLPGDAIAARKRAALEEKRKKEEEELAQARQFKARPYLNKPRPASMIVKQTASSRARMSIYGGDEETAASLKENGPSTGALKRSGTLTGAATSSVKKMDMAAKRSSMILGQTATNAAQKRNSMILGQTATNAAQKRNSIVASTGKDAPRAPITIPKRQSLMATTQPSAVRRTSSISRPRHVSGISSATNNTPVSKSIVTAEDVAKQRQKGREVFNRDRVEKEEREKGRRDKEDAARRARADAAERGRQASREWAEKQKRKLLETKAQQSHTVAGAAA